MSAPLDPTIRDAGDCGCGEGVAASTPRAVDNPPGQARIAYRAGTHGQWKRSLLAGLSRADRPALRALDTREDDDFTIALLDAWAVVGDVLTFYQERIAQESYLRTATERQSLVELVRSIGYELRPGVAADVDLAFTLEEAPGSPAEVIIPVETRVQSVPGPGELPQTFETVEELAARPPWNALKPFVPVQLVGNGDDTLQLAGVVTNLLPGDALAFLDAARLADATKGSWELRRVKSSTPDRQGQRTTVVLDKALSAVGVKTAVGYVNPAIFALRQRAALFGAAAPDVRTMPEVILEAFAEATTGTPPHAQNAEWSNFTLASVDGQSATVKTNRFIHVDGNHPEILVGSWLVLEAPAAVALFQVKSVAADSRNRFAINNKTTRVELAGVIPGKDKAGADKGILEDFDGLIRQTLVLAQSESLTLATIDTPIAASGDTTEIELDGLFDELPIGRRVIASGLLSSDGTPQAEIATIDDVTNPTGNRTVVHIRPKLAFEYLRTGFTLLGNVARATHGETVSEVLGSGDAGQALQRFTLRQSPLTYVRSDESVDPVAALAVYADDVLWREVPTLIDSGPRERVYVLRTDAEGKTTIGFGDGKNGARLPTGRENVRAKYRKGLGTAGNVRAGQLMLLLTRPLGVRSVQNPLPAAGGAPAEADEDARENAPPSVLTLGRAVSLGDYEDFARSVVGVTKAHAVWTWNGDRRGIFLTVADADPEASQIAAALEQDLIDAIAAVSDPNVPVRIVYRTAVKFRATVDVKVAADREPELVREAVAAALADGFSFEARALGQNVALSELFAAVQRVEGVEMAMVRELRRSTVPGSSDRPDVLVAHAPRDGEGAKGADAAEVLFWESAASSIGVLP